EHERIAAGLVNLAVAEQIDRSGSYQLQARIAACHAQAKRWQDTDWAKIAAVYEELDRVSPSPVITLNRAVAVGMVEGPAAGLALLDSSEGQLSLGDYYLLPSTRADFLRRLQRWDEAIAEYQR